MVISEKVREKIADYDYGVFYVSALSEGVNTLSAGAFGLTEVWAIGAGAATQATLSATGTAMTTVSTAEGRSIVITGITDGDAIILEVMGQ